MTILTLSKRGTLRLPKEVLNHLGDAKHLQVRFGSSGIALVPVKIQAQGDLKAIPRKN